MRFIALDTRIANLRNKFTLPNRLKGTVVEKWTNYWKGLLSDYADVTMGVLKEAKDKPLKAATYTIVGYGLYACSKRNPDEEAFLQKFRNASNAMIMVHPSLQNSESVEYIKRMQLDLNQQRLRFTSLGILTIVWEDLFDKDDCTYLAICKYTKVSWWNFHEHIVDIGFWNEFWRLKWNLLNFDVNYL